MKTILIVEDNAAFRADLAQGLQYELYHTLEAQNGLIGLAMINDYVPDLIISDIEMPVMTGIEMLLLIKQNSRISGIPFIFITAHSDELIRKRVTDLGADLCLAKPVSLGHLIKSIQALLNT